MQLHKKHALGSGYPRNGTPMGMSISVLYTKSCHEMRDTVYSEAKLNSKSEL